MLPLPSSVLITGASSGLGAALAYGYARSGVTLALVARHEGRLHEVAEACRLAGAVVLTKTLDVRDAAALAQFIGQVDVVHPLDLVIANAGISAGSGGGTETEAQARAIFETNVTGVLNTIHPILPAMQMRGRGQVAIVSSLAGIRALPSAPAYSASKAAVRYYGEALRGLMKPFGVQVSVVCPGYITTPMTAINDFPMPFVMSPERAVRRIQKGLARGVGRIVFPRRLYYPLWLLSCVHHRITDPIFDALPAKPHFS